MKKITSRLLCIVSMIFPLCNAMAQNSSALIYREVIEDQDMSMGGDLVKYRNPYTNEVVEIKRLRRQIIGNSDPDINGKKFNHPLTVGMKWEQDEWRTDNMYCYYVDKKDDVTVPAGTFKDCFKIVYVTCPDDSAWWYYPGLGVIKYEYRHHGTIANTIIELVSR